MCLAEPLFAWGFQTSGHTLPFSGIREKKMLREWKGGREGGKFKSYLAVQLSNVQTLENLASLIGVADVLECLRRVLASDVEQNLFTTSAF